MGLTTIFGWVMSFVPPHVEVHCYDIVDGQKRILEAGIAADPPLPTPEDRDRRCIKLPIQLAFSNSEWWNLEDVQAVFHFRPDVSVVSSGHELLTDDASAHIYRHQIGTLAPTHEFDPLEARDTISIAIDSMLVSAFSGARPGHPEYIEFLKPASPDLPVRRTFVVPFDLELRAKGRPSKWFSSEISGELPSDAWWPPPYKAGRVPLTRELADQWRRCFFGERDSSAIMSRFYLKRLDQWLSWTTSRRGPTHSVQYRIDGIPNRADLDLNGDGLLDIVLEDSASSGRLSRALIPSPPYPFKVPFSMTWGRTDPFGSRSLRWIRVYGP